MKQEWKLWLRLGVTLFLLYLAVHYWPAVSTLLLLALGAAFPLFLGCVIAYAVNILMSIYERFLFPADQGFLAALHPDGAPGHLHQLRVQNP